MDQLQSYLDAQFNPQAGQQTLGQILGGGGGRNFGLSASQPPQLPFQQRQPLPPINLGRSGFSPAGRFY
jgi:hypothetical protein